MLFSSIKADTCLTDSSIIDIVNQIEFDDNSFDCSIIAHAIAVVAEPDMVLKEMIRVTKPKGRIVIVNHHKEHQFYLDIFPFLQQYLVSLKYH